MSVLIGKTAEIRLRPWQLSTGVVVAGTLLAVLALPPLVYAWLSYAKFGLLKPSYYVPHEALWQALRSGSLHEVWDASLIVVNMTSGHLLANLYTLTVGQLVLSLLLGIAIALNFSALLALRRACSAGSHAGQAAGAAGTSLFATVAASSAGIFGCCGGGAAGGVLTLAGVGTTTAIQIGAWSPYIQVLLILLFLANYFRIRA